MDESNTWQKPLQLGTYLRTYCRYRSSRVHMHVPPHSVPSQTHARAAAAAYYSSSSAGVNHGQRRPERRVAPAHAALLAGRNACPRAGSMKAEGTKKYNTYNSQRVTRHCCREVPVLTLPSPV
jgi:hypothetical protein